MTWMQDLWGCIRDIHRQDWQKIPGAALVATILFGLAVAYFANSGSHWVFPLDHANLAFHEFGHPLFGSINWRLGVYGGTLGQLIFPLLTACVFWGRREAPSFAACAIWFFENFFNISRYMADARAHQLPLVGGMDPELAHDWTEIFVRWGLLKHDIGISRITAILGWAGVVAIVIWLAVVWNRQRDDA